MSGLRSSLAALLLLAGCAGAGGTASAVGAPPAASAEEVRLRTEAARERLAAAETALRAEEESGQGTLARLKAEKEISEAALRKLRETDHPHRVAEAELAAARAADGLEDAKDELSQLEEMYKENDLAERTKEIVVKRGRRSLERAQADHAIRMKAVRDLKETAIPLEIRKAEHEIQQKQRELELELVRLQGRLAAKRAELLDARSALRKAEPELSKLPAAAPR